ncbi:hypothetical protein R5R35_009342 [Gryllus longicercus]|uniref:Nucleolar protein 11 n=1 Tax=Gryllus longicercus TaxID=2509291 RepID=A0AAN9V4F0_9ORTH
MAKLSVAYGLCPLIDNNSLLGVGVDAVPDCVIVTIGKNIVIRYKFQDQKQVSSWSSKDKLTSPVVYNVNNSQYSAVFNHDQLRMWSEEDQLDKVKKYKFQEPLHCVIPDLDGDTAFILYRCGYVTTLTQALETRKSTLSNTVLKNSDYIKEHTLVSCNGVKLVAFTSSNEKDEITLHVVPVITGAPSAQYHVLWNNVSLIGHALMAKENSCFLFTLWSDGSLFSFKFLPTVDINFPGTFLQKVTSVNSKHPVAITPISNSHLAFFGADSSEEGATLILLNLEFQLVQSRLHFKLYTKPPRLWNVSSHLLVAVGNNLIAVPYHLEVEQLSTLVGTHSSTVPVTESSWMNSNIKKLEPIDKHAPKNLCQKIKLLRQEGFPQASILLNILPDILEEKDVKSLLWCLKTFSDVPERCVVQILKFCFSKSDAFLNKKSENIVKETTEKENMKNISKQTTDQSLNCHESEKQLLVDAILSVSFSDVCIMPHLRGVPFTTILSLLNYLSDLMEHESTVPPLRVIEWLCLVLDSHYQKYLLSHNEEVLSILTKLSEEVNSQIEGLEELKKLTPLLHKLQNGKIPSKLSEMSDRKYSIETLQLY